MIVTCSLLFYPTHKITDPIKIQWPLQQKTVPLTYSEQNHFISIQLKLADSNKYLTTPICLYNVPL